MERNKVVIEVEPAFLQKFAEFTKLALAELHRLRAQLSNQLQKEASENIKKAEYHNALVKVANVLNESDFDFVTGTYDSRTFIKKASEDPSYLAKVLMKVCEAADVSLIGKPARVATNRKVANDPVYNRAFGIRSNYETELLFDLDD